MSSWQTLEPVLVVVRPESWRACEATSSAWQASWTGGGARDEREMADAVGPGLTLEKSLARTSLTATRVLLCRIWNVRKTWLSTFLMEAAINILSSARNYHKNCSRTRPAVTTGGSRPRFQARHGISGVKLAKYRKSLCYGVRMTRRVGSTLLSSANWVKQSRRGADVETTKKSVGHGVSTSIHTY